MDDKRNENILSSNTSHQSDLQNFEYNSKAGRNSLGQRITNNDYFGEEEMEYNSLEKSNTISEDKADQDSYGQLIINNDCFGQEQETKNVSLKKSNNFEDEVDKNAFEPRENTQFFDQKLEIKANVGKEESEDISLENSSNSKDEFDEVAFAQREITEFFDQKFEIKPNVGKEEIEDISLEKSKTFSVDCTKRNEACMISEENIERSENLGNSFLKPEHIENDTNRESEKSMLEDVGIQSKSTSSETFADTEKNVFFQESEHNFNWEEISPQSLPVIGKPMFLDSDCKPVIGNDESPQERNELRAQNDTYSGPRTDFLEWIKQRASRTREEVEADERNTHFEAIRTARSIIMITSRICAWLLREKPSEKNVIKGFSWFLQLPISPLALLYAPQFVHVMMLCRSCDEFSLLLRKAANRCYYACHAMFPVMIGSNFQTVFAYELKNTKFLFDVNTMNELAPYYGEYESSDDSDSNDSGISIESSCEA